MFHKLLLLKQDKQFNDFQYVEQFSKFPVITSMNFILKMQIFCCILFCISNTTAKYISGRILNA